MLSAGKLTDCRELLSIDANHAKFINLLPSPEVEETETNDTYFLV
jgi:hypothetical protein